MSTIDYRDRLRLARLDAGMSQHELARRAGISVSTISAVEAHRQELTAPRLFAWARECEASLDVIAADPVTVPAPALQAVSA